MKISSFLMKCWVSAIDEAKWRLICQKGKKKSLNSDQKSPKFQWQPINRWFIWKIDWDSNLLSIFRRFFCRFFQKKIAAPCSSQTSQKQHPFQPLQSKLSKKKKMGTPLIQSKLPKNNVYSNQAQKCLPSIFITWESLLLCNYISLNENYFI